MTGLMWLLLLFLDIVEDYPTERITEAPVNDTEIVEMSNHVGMGPVIVAVVLLLLVIVAVSIVLIVKAVKKNRRS